MPVRFTFVRLLILVLCLPIPPVLAEEQPSQVEAEEMPAQRPRIPDPSTEQYIALPEVSVTATRYEEAAGNIGYNLTTISKEQIRNQNVTRTNQGLRNMAGILVPESGNVSNISILHLRGVNAPRGPLLNDTVGTLLDGLSISKPTPGFSTQFESGKYPLFNVDRVEVLRGPAAVLYGKDAFAGVVNIISKKPHAGPPSSEMTFFANQWPSYGGSGEVNSGDELWRKPARFNLGFGRHDLHTFRDHSFGINEQVYGNLQLDLTPRTHLRIGGSYSHYFQERPSTLTRQQLAQDRTQAATANPGFLETYLTLVRTDLVHEFSKDLTLTNSLLYNNSNDLFDLNDLLVQKNRRRLGHDPSKRIINDTRVTWSSLAFGRENQLQAGLWIDHFRADFLFRIRDLATNVETTREQGDGTQTIFSPYFLNRFNVTERMVLWTGLRWDRIHMKRNQVVNFGDPGYSVSTAFDAFSPHVGLVYHFTNEANAYVNWSRSFRPISLRALTPAELALGGTKENLTNYEIGARFKTLGSRLFVKTAAFWMSYEDQVNSVFRGFDPSASNREGQSIHRGVEVEIAYEILPRLTMAVSAAYLDAFVKHLRATANDTLFVLDGFRVHNVPRWSVYPSLSYKTEQGWVGMLNGRYVGDRMSDQWNTVRLPSFFVMDFSLGYQPEGKGYGITASVLNITDTTYNALAVRFNPFGEPTFDPGASRTVAIQLWARL